MPNIRQTEAPRGIGLNPSETGIEAVAGAARRIGTFYNQTADLYGQEGSELKSTITDAGSVAENYMTHRDISAGAANGAKFIAQKNDEWNEIAKTADPNDVTIKQKFIEENLNPALDQFKAGFSTERSSQWAEHFVDQYRQHMSEKTSADMSTLAGIAVRKNVATTVNALSSAVASDPSSLDFALKSVDHSIGATVASSPNISATDAAAVTSEVGLKAKESIVKAAVSGMITKNPNVDLDAIQKKYGDYINGAEMKMFQKAAQTQAKVDLLQQKQLETYQRQQNERKAESAANDNLTKNVALDPATGRPTINPNYFKSALDIAKMPDAPVGLARTLIDWGEHQQNLKAQPQVSDPTTRQDLTDRMFDPNKPTTTRDLMQAQIAGKISDHDFTVMHRLVTELQTTPLTGPVWQTTAAAVKDALIVSVPGLPGKDSVGTSNYATFMQTFLPEYIAKSRAGTLPPNALDVKDPNSMISQSMAPFKRTQGQRMTDYVSAAGGIGAPAGEKPRMIGDTPVPAALAGIAALQFNKAKGQWRDQTTGTIYDAKGVEVK
jgi:hypothetical protein